MGINITTDNFDDYGNEIINGVPNDPNELPPRPDPEPAEERSPWAILANTLRKVADRCDDNEAAMLLISLTNINKLLEKYHDAL